MSMTKAVSPNPTRSLTPFFRAILGYTQEHGEIRHSATVDGRKPGATLAYLGRKGLLHPEKIPSPDRRASNGPTITRYTLTDAGRQALKDGTREAGRPSSFNQTNVFAFEKQKVGPCAHHWDVDNTLMQHHVCRDCGAEKDAPFTFGREFLRVGGGKPSKIVAFMEAR